MTLSSGRWRNKWPTSIVKTITKQKEEIVSQISGIEEKPLKDVNVVIGATDVHEFGKELCKKVLLEAGANVFDLGTTISIDDLADTVIETEGKAVLISTYNGIAYSFAKDMMDKFKENHIKVPVIMGGRLNEPVDGSDLPVDVSERIARMGINVDNNVETMIDFIKNKIA